MTRLFSAASQRVGAALRLSTRAEHDQIEWLLKLTEPMPLSRYATIMAGFAAFLETWEPRIEASLPAPLKPWYQSRQRAAWANADLQWLSAVHPSDLAVANAARAAAADLPLKYFAQVLGSLYVIEGAALGGQVLMVPLHTSLGVNADRGARYFHGFGAKTGQLWRDFCDLAAQALGSSDADLQQACESARRTFQALITTFDALDQSSGDDDS